MRRDRAAAETARLKQLGELHTQLVVLERDRLQDIAEAEAATRQLAAALSRALRANAEMSKVSHLITGERTPTPLSGPDFVNRLAGRLAAIMSTIPTKGHPLKSAVLPSKCPLSCHYTSARAGGP